MTESALLYEPGSQPNSPGLQAFKIAYKPFKSPPPFESEDSSSSSDEEDMTLDNPKARKTKSKRVRPCQGDAVLLNQLAPNRPDIAQLAAEVALDTDVLSESESTVGDMGDASPTAGAPDAAINIAGKALSVVDRESNKTSTPILLVEESTQRLTKPVNTSSIDYVKEEPTKDLQAAYPKPVRPQPHRIKTESTFEHIEDGDSIAHSPTLARFAITPSEPIASTLPALQNSPGKPNPIHSPDNNQRLPSIHTALGDQLEHSPLPPISAASPTMSRPPVPYFGSHTGPSPAGSYTHSSPASSMGMSPPSNMPVPGLWRSSTKSETSMSSTVSDTTTPSTVSHSPSCAYPSPNVPEHRLTMDGDSASLLTGPMAPNGPFTSTAFKCTYPGCIALPFSTQYLLNSHTNVHSQNRPHFCPVKNCPRGMGGKGFKRKNEMIRHGLVHDSPGYVCPFCPDQQHKYPRPDNLQRHVRVHHVDKDKEDPLLRDVLAQRPDGPNRGRRRRLGS